jgi:hypothetical protein
LDIGHHFFSLYCGRKELNHLSLRIDEELGEVPGDNFGSLCLGVKERTVVTKESEHWMSVFTVNFHLLHNGETSVEVLLDKIGDFFWATALLSEELVAGESNNFKSFVSPSLMSFDHFGVVFRGESSLAGHIDHHDELPIPQFVEGKVLTIDILDCEVKEALGGWRLYAL